MTIRVWIAGWLPAVLRWNRRRHGRSRCAWRGTLEASHEKFIGLWTEEEFAGVIRAAMDTLLNRAAPEFAGAEFAAQIAGS